MPVLTHAKPLNSVLIKPAGPDCNMACTYCFYLEKAALFSETKTHRMTEDILEGVVRQVMIQGAQEVSFGWQGGEPTLMGLPFYEKAVTFQKKYGRNQTVGNGLQTNGIVLDSHWSSFLKEYNFLIGLSLDGPQHVHDHYRLSRGGEGTWALVHDRAKMLLDAGVEVNALSVVNNYSVQFPEEIYEFHKSLGLNYMQFIPCVETDKDEPTKPASFTVSAEQFGKFLVTLFDLWQADFKDSVPTTSLRYFESVFYTYVNMLPPMCTLMEECGNYVVVEYNGEVFACDFFVEPAWKLGNIIEDDLVDMLNSPRQNKFGRQKAKRPDKCVNCPWLVHCWGGCTKDRLRHPEGQDKYHLCESYNMFFEHADERLLEMAVEWTKQQNYTDNRTERHKQPGQIKLRRNDPCLCGSGKKLKHCCGRM